MIPADAVKPLDRRTNDAKQNTAHSTYLRMPRSCPALLMSDLYNTPGSASKCVESLSESPEAAVLLEAWLAYSRGEPERACGLARQLLTVPADFYGTISTGLLLSSCAIWLGDIPLWMEGRKHILSAKCGDENDYELCQFWHAISDAGLLDMSHFPEWFQKGRFENVPVDCQPIVMFNYAKYLRTSAKKLAFGVNEFDDIQGLDLVRALPYFFEAMVTQPQITKAILVEASFRMLCAEIYHSLEDRENTNRHLDAALGLLLPDRLYGVLAEFRPLFGRLLDERLKLFDEDAVKIIQQMQDVAMSGASKLSQKLLNIPMSDRLTEREYEVAQLAAFGKSNAEIAERLHISVSSVKTTISTIMNKTGAQKRTQFGAYIL